jgi:hypothetical protein
MVVIDERPPQPPRRIGRIDAVARTPIMGFREDVSIRITPTARNRASISAPPRAISKATSAATPRASPS